MNDDVTKCLHLLSELTQLSRHYAVLFHLLFVSSVFAINILPKHVADEKGMHNVLQVESTLTINTDMSENKMDL